MADRIDRYEIVRKLATGGMADVFLALQWGDGGFVREVVVKRLHPHMSGDKSLLEDFRNEADLLARLGGPGIPHVHEFRCSSGREWYMAMEHVPGPTVCELVRETSAGTPLPLHVALSIGVELCRILDAVHDYVDPASGEEFGVVHGDLTPSNVVIDGRGHVHLLDFGIAGGNDHRRSRMGGDYGIRGTVGYFPPEAAQSSELSDRRADVFSLGALLYELVTGEDAFTRVAIEYLNAIPVGPSARPCEVDGSLAPALDDLIMLCLSPDPNDRPQLAGDVANALEALASEEGLELGSSHLADYVQAYFPVQAGDSELAEESPAHRDFVIPIPDAVEDPSGAVLSADERDELLADLALFAPDGMFDDPSEVAAPPPPSPLPPPPRPVPPPPPSDRAARSEKATPIAFPAAQDIASSKPPRTEESAISTKRPPPPGRRSRPSVHPDSDKPIEPKADDSGFYIYVADDD
ncbi:MAG: serine/threonine protein kinase [Polyangiales bacterium]